MVWYCLFLIFEDEYFGWFFSILWSYILQFTAFCDIDLYYAFLTRLNKQMNVWLNMHRHLRIFCCRYGLSLTSCLMYVIRQFNKQIKHKIFIGNDCVKDANPWPWLFTYYLCYRWRGIFPPSIRQEWWIIIRPSWHLCMICLKKDNQMSDVN